MYRSDTPPVFTLPSLFAKFTNSVLLQCSPFQVSLPSSRTLSSSSVHPSKSLCQVHELCPPPVFTLPSLFAKFTNSVLLQCSPFKVSLPSSRTLSSSSVHPSKSLCQVHELCPPPVFTLPSLFAKFTNSVLLQCSPFKVSLPSSRTLSSSSVHPSKSLCQVHELCPPPVFTLQSLFAKFTNSVLLQCSPFKVSLPSSRTLSSSSVHPSKSLCQVHEPCPPPVFTLPSLFAIAHPSSPNLANFEMFYPLSASKTLIACLYSKLISANLI